MPRPRRVLPAPTPSAIIASASEITDTKINVPRGGTKEWQEEAWYFWDAIGELRYATQWKAQACSRATLKITETTPQGDVDVDSGPEVDALDILFGGETGHAAMLERVALHLGVPGESYVVGEPADVGGEETWDVMSNDEITRSGSSKKWKVDRGDEPRDLRDGSTVMRLWRPHPRKFVEATSSVRSVLPVLRELEALEKRVAADVDSRLAGAGLLLYPNEAAISPDPEFPTIDPLLAKLTKAMTTAIANRADAAAVVPVVLQVPGEMVDKIKHVTFSTPFDERTKELRDEAIRRLALGLDLPPEQLLGMGASNHWSAWQIDEAGLKTSIEPELEVITTGLTRVWLRAAVKALGGTFDPSRRINYDVSELRLRPDRSAQAFEAYDRLELSGEALRRETGFEPSDAPEDAALQQIILRKLVLSNQPDLVAAASKVLGVPVQIVPVPGETIRVAETPAQAELPAGPASPVPDTQGDAATPPSVVPASAGVQVAAELLAHRAIERGRARVNNRIKVPRPVPADRLDYALEGAWTLVPTVARQLGVDADEMTAALDMYVRGVLTDGGEGAPTVLARCLTARALEASRG